MKPEYMQFAPPEHRLVAGGYTIGVWPGEKLAIAVESDSLSACYFDQVPSDVVVGQADNSRVSIHGDKGKWRLFVTLNNEDTNRVIEFFRDYGVIVRS